MSGWVAVVLFKCFWFCGRVLGNISIHVCNEFILFSLCFLAFKKSYVYKVHEFIKIIEVYYCQVLQESVSQIKVVVINNYSTIKMTYLVILACLCWIIWYCSHVHEGDLKMHFIFCKLLCIGDYINSPRKVVFLCMPLEMPVCISHQWYCQEHCHCSAQPNNRV